MIARLGLAVQAARERPLWAGAGFAVLCLALYHAPGSPLPERSPAAVVLIGAVLGTVTGLLAMGLVLIYRSDRIINFAYGSMGGVGGVLGINLFLRSKIPYLLALLIGVATGIAVGAAVQRIVIRRFSRSSRLVLTVATIGLAQVLGGMELLIPVWLFNSSGVVLGGYDTPLDLRARLDPVIFTGDHMLIVVAVPLAVAGLLWFLLRTDAGVAIRGAAENNERALLLGIPVRRLSLIVWMLAGGLSAATFLLKAPFAGVAPGVVAGPSVLLPGLAAAVLARMDSLPRAAVAGVALGVLEQLVLWNTDAASTVDAVFLAVILTALLLQRDRLSRALDAGASMWSPAGIARAIPAQLRSLPEVRGARIALGLAVFLAAVLIPRAAGPSSVSLMSVALVWAMVAVSLVVLTGWAGNISLGQFAIVGCSAIAAGNMVDRWNLDLFYTLAVAGAVGAAVALLVGVPALRIRGLFLAVTTLAFAVAVDSYLLNPVNFPELVPERIPRPVLWERFDLESELAMYYFCLAILIVTLVTVHRIRGARSGRAMLAARDNHGASEAMAVSSVAMKLSAFTLAGIIAGVGGGLHVLILHGARTGSYQPILSLEVFSMAVIGGLGSPAGAVAGVFALRWLEQVISGPARLLITGTGLLVILLVLPGGLWQAVLSLRDRLLRVVADRRGLIVPSLLADRRVEDDDAPEDEAELLEAALTEDEEPTPTVGAHR